MAFESIRNFKSIRSSSNKEAMLSMSVINDAPYKDGTIPRVASFILNEEIMYKFNLYEKRFDVLLDLELNQAMFKVSKEGFKISTPKKDGGIISKRGYLRFRLPEKISYLDNFCGVEVTIIDVLEDSIIFELPKNNGA